jgi:CRP-like cAMP-binding protein
LQREAFGQLRPLSVFEPLSDEQITQLAKRAQAHRFTAGELLVRQGERGDSLIVVKAGNARVDVRKDGRVTTVARFGPGDFFGEMSLLTGERRNASVIAEGETEVVVLGKEALAAVLEVDLEALAALSQVVEQRLQETAEKTAAAATRRTPGPEQAPPGNLLTRIQGFLGLRGRGNG